IGRLVDHQGGGASLGGGEGQSLGVPDRPADARDEWHAPADSLRRGMDEALGLLDRQTIELARVAVCDEDMDASGYRTVDDRAEAAAIEGVVAVEGRDEDAGDASQGGVESGRLAHGNAF